MMNFRLSFALFALLCGCLFDGTAMGQFDCLNRRTEVEAHHTEIAGDFLRCAQELANEEEVSGESRQIKMTTLSLAMEVEKIRYERTMAILGQKQGGGTLAQINQRVAKMVLEQVFSSTALVTSKLLEWIALHGTGGLCNISPSKLDEVYMSTIKVCIGKADMSKEGLSGADAEVSNQSGHVFRNPYLRATRR